MTTEHDDELEFRVASGDLCAGRLRDQHAEKKRTKRTEKEGPRNGAGGQHGSPSLSVAGRTAERANAERVLRAAHGRSE